MWKLLYDSIVGTSHHGSGAECQDSCFATPLNHNGETFLIVVCSDGAGSAKESKIGSALACRIIAKKTTEFVKANGLLANVNFDVVSAWVRAVRDALTSSAVEKELPIRELACTLLCAIIGQNAAVFVQIGDGAIIILDGGNYRPVFWPQSGEYQNTTFFVTDSEFESRIQHELIERPLDEVALFTDGLQMLALNYAEKKAHAPFFLPMFASLRSAEDATELAVPFRQFLDSPLVNARTDDDKTLVLATRLNHCADAS